MPDHVAFPQQDVNMLKADVSICRTPQSKARPRQVFSFSVRATVPFKLVIVSREHVFLWSAEEEKGKGQRRDARSDGHHYPADIITAGRAGPGCFPFQTKMNPISSFKTMHTHTHRSWRDGCTLLYVDSVENFWTTETKAFGKIREQHWWISSE